MSKLKLSNTTRKRKNSTSLNSAQSVRQRTLNKERKRANGVNPPELGRNVLALIMMTFNKPLPVFSKASRSALRNAGLYRLDRNHRSAIRNFPNRNFVAVNLTNDQKKRVRQALQSLMIQRHYGYFNMPFSQNDVVIKQHYPDSQGTVGRFDIYVDGIRLTEPISRKSNFYAPYLKLDPRRGFPIGRNMNKAGWPRLLFEPYDG